MKYILTFDHSDRTNGASNILKQIISIAVNKKDVRVIDFIFSKEKKTNNTTFLFTLDNYCFLKSFLLDFFLFTIPNLNKVFTKTKSIIKDDEIIVIWNTIVRLWYIPFIKLIFFNKKIKIYAYCHEAPVYFLKRLPFRCFYKLFFRFIFKIIILDNEQKKLLLQFDSSLKNFVLINNPVTLDISIRKYQLDLPSYKNTEKSFIFLASTLSYRKGYDYLLNYINNLNKRKIKFSVYGQNSLETIEIEKKFHNYNSNNFIQKFGLSNIEDIEINNFHAYISFSRSEAQPLVPLEMAFLKIPLLLSNIPAHKNIFHFDSAIFFNGKDPLSIENAINKFFLLSSFEKNNMINNAYSIVTKRFSKEIFRDNINKLFFS